MIKVAEKASKILIRDFGELEKLQVSDKSPNDFVKNSALKVEKIIIEEIRKARPNYSFFNKKTGLRQFKDKKNIWIFDPINGDKNFLHGVPHFAISIALLSHNEIISGLIFDPIKNEMFYAEKNNGAFFNNHRLRVSKKKNIEDCLFAFDERLGNKEEINIRKLGSVALDMAYVAAGRYDGLFQKNINLCEVAAGMILVKESGGIINDLELNNQNDFTIYATTPDVDIKFKKITNIELEN
jgi:myo-inositol-1(or 4)-monophosphatase